jgi:hypothetical protein
MTPRKPRKINYKAVPSEVLASRLTIKESAQVLDMSVGNIHKLIKSKEIKTFKWNNVQFVSLESLKVYCFLDGENNLK